MKKTGVILITITIFLIVAANQSICQPYDDIWASGISYTFDSTSNIISLTGTVGYSTNMFYYPDTPSVSFEVRWYLNLTYYNGPYSYGGDFLIGKSWAYYVQAFTPDDAVFATIDLDTVTSLDSVSNGTYYIGIAANYDHGGEVMPYEDMYYNNCKYAYEPINVYFDTLPPNIINSLPDSGDENVSRKDTLFIAFSEPINQTGFTFTLLPNPDGVSTKWNSKHDTLRVAHNIFKSATVETLNITGAMDLKNNPLSGRSVIIFTTVDDPPEIIYSTPDSGATNVARDATVKIVFSRPIDTTTFAFSVAPDPGGVSVLWNITQDTMSIVHEMFSFATEETISINHAEDFAGHSLVGRNVIVFKTWSGPIIDIVSKPSSPQSQPGPYSVVAVITDAGGKATKAIYSDSLFYQVGGGSWKSISAFEAVGDTYTFQIPRVDTGIVQYYLQAWDNVGLSAVEPFSGYYLFFVDAVPPVIISSTPDSGESNVVLGTPIRIVFSEPIDTNSFSYTLTPHPGGVSEKWNKTHDIVDITHSIFTCATPETIIITHALDTLGNNLSQGNVIIFSMGDPSPSWDSRFYSFGTLSIGDVVYSVEGDGGNVYIGGSFMVAGGDTVRHIAKWNGSSWSSLGGGMDREVYSIAVSKDTVYAGGAFNMAGEDSAKCIAKWNGSSWSALGEGTNGAIYTIAISEGVIYAGGNFTTAGGDSARYIAQWDGYVWASLGSGVNGVVQALAIFDGKLYAGGNFTTAGGDSAYHIAKWDGTKWEAVGSGTSGNIYALTANNNGLYVGGAFNTAGGQTAKNIAQWDGSFWSGLGQGTISNIYSIGVQDELIYVFGAFYSDDSDSTYSIAKWNGAQWSDLYNGTDNIVYDLTVMDTAIFVGGSFTLAGGKPSNYFGIYYNSPAGIDDEEVLAAPVVDRLMHSWPEPFRSAANIKYQISKTGRVSLKVYNIFGQAVRTLVDKEQSSGMYNVTWDGRDASGRTVSAGVYFYRLDAEGVNGTGRLTLIR